MSAQRLASLREKNKICLTALSILLRSTKKKSSDGELGGQKAGPDLTGDSS